MPGESNTFVTEYQVNASAANATGSFVLDNRACVVMNEEPNEWCGVVEQSFVDEEARLYIVKTGMPEGQVLAGEPLEYTVWVYNLGLSDARNVRVTDDILSTEGVTLDELYGIEGPITVNASGMAIEATAEVLPAGTRMGYRAVVSWPEAVDVDNLVHVQADTPDPDMSNNDAKTANEIVPVADIAIGKTVTNAGYAGQPISYHIHVENYGPSTAENVVVTDHIPAGVTIVDVTTSFGSHTEGVEGDANAPMVFSLGNMPAGGEWDADITCVVAADYVGVLTNDVSVKSDVLDTDMSDNRSKGTAVISAAADLQIVKGEEPDPVNAGDTLDWTLLITNHGPSKATQVGVADFLPAEVEFLSGEVFAGSAQVTFSSEYNNLVAAEIGDMMPGDQVGIILHTKVKSDTPEGYIVNAAFVESDPLEGAGTYDPSTANNVAVSSTRVTKAVDLTVTKSDDPDPVIAGSDLYYTIAVSNNGPSDASNVVVNDLFSDGVTYLNWTGSNDWVKTDLAEWTLSSLAAGETKSFMVHVMVNSDVAVTANGPTTITNNVSVTSDEAELNEANNTFAEDTFVNESADLKIVKIGLPESTVRAGDELTYTVYVYNLGLSDAREVTVTDDILSDGVFGTPVLDSGAFTCNVTGGEIVCTIPAIAAGTHQTFRVTVTANDKADITNWTCAEAATPDPNAENNCAQVITSVVPWSDLGITKAVTHQGPYYAGSTVTYTLTVNNYGPSAAENVVIQDYLPAHTTIVDVSPAVAYTAGVAGDPNAPMVIPVGTLAANETWSVNVTLLIDASFPYDATLDGEFLTNDVKVTSDVLDANVSNNRDSEVILVEFESVLTVDKQAASQTVQAGDTASFSIAIRNEGPSTANDVVAIDLYDEYLSYVDYSIANGAGNCVYVSAQGGVVCNLGDLKPGESRIIDMVFAVDPKTPDQETVQNAVAVQANTAEDEPYEFLAGDEATITVINNADLAITKSADKLEVSAGQQLTYTIDVVNNGPTDAVNVVVTDTLPQGVTYVNDDLGACAFNAGALECGVGNLAAGQSVSFKVLVTVNADTLGTIVNEAIVSSETADLNTTNNSATVSMPVNGYADLRVVKFGKPEGQVRAGEELTYTITVDNLGTGVAHGVALVDTMTSDGTFTVRRYTSNLPVDDSGFAAGTYNKTGSFALALAQDLPITFGGSPWVVTVVVTANDDQVINNCVAVDGADFDPNVNNNQSCAEHTILNVADLAVTKTAMGEVATFDVGDQQPGYLEADAVTAGLNLYYTIEVSNDGPSLAENVVVQDMLPAGVTFVEATPAADTSLLPSKLVWNLGDLASGNSVTLEVKVNVPAYVSQGTVLRNTAAVMSDIFDNHNADNSSSNATTVNAAADIVVAKESLPQNVLFGNTAEYDILIRNLGPSDAGLVKVTDYIPDAIDGESWKYSVDGGMTFTEGYGDVKVWIDMPAGREVSLVVTGVVNTYWPFENTVCAASTTVWDPMAGNNCSTVQNEQYLAFSPIQVRGAEVVNHRPDLTVSKIVATPSYVEVTVTNIGDRRLIEPFWVDLYVSPNPAPTKPNDIWENLSEKGWAWRVTGDSGLPLEVGESLVLVVDATDSGSFPLAEGLTVYAQADSWNPNTAYGMVLEQDEVLHKPYNNIRWANVGRVWGYSGEGRTGDTIIRGGAVSTASDDGLPARP